jgi:hypothetical protein
MNPVKNRVWASYIIMPLSFFLPPGTAGEGIRHDPNEI